MFIFFFSLFYHFSCSARNTLTCFLLCTSLVLVCWPSHTCSGNFNLKKKLSVTVSTCSLRHSCLQAVTCMHTCMYRYMYLLPCMWRQWIPSRPSLKTWYSILDPWKLKLETQASKVNSLFSKISRIENRVSSWDCQLTFERYCTFDEQESLQEALSSVIL